MNPNCSWYIILLSIVKVYSLNFCCKFCIYVHLGYWCEVLITYIFGISIRVILASWNELGSIIYFNFLKSLHRVDIISSLNIWQNSSVKSFGCGVFCHITLNCKFSVSHRYSAIQMICLFLNSFGNLCLSRIFFFPFHLNCLTHWQNCSIFPYYSFSMCINCNDITYLILDIGQFVFSLFIFTVSLSRVLSTLNLVDFRKDQLIYFPQRTIDSLSFFFPISLFSVLILSIYIFIFIVGLVCFSVSTFIKLRLKTLKSIFSIMRFRAINFSLNTTLAACHRF